MTLNSCPSSGVSSLHSPVPPAFSNEGFSGFLRTAEAPANLPSFVLSPSETRPGPVSPDAKDRDAETFFGHWQRKTPTFKKVLERGLGRDDYAIRIVIDARKSTYDDRFSFLKGFAAGILHAALQIDGSAVSVAVSPGVTPGLSAYEESRTLSGFGEREHAARRSILAAEKLDCLAPFASGIRASASVLAGRHEERRLLIVLLGSDEPVGDLKQTLSVCREHGITAAVFAPPGAKLFGDVARHWNEAKNVFETGAAFLYELSIRASERLPVRGISGEKPLIRMAERGNLFEGLTAGNSPRRLSPFGSFGSTRLSAFPRVAPDAFSGKKAGENPLFDWILGRTKCHTSLWAREIETLTRAGTWAAEVIVDNGDSVAGDPIVYPVLLAEGLRMREAFSSFTAFRCGLHVSPGLGGDGLTEIAAPATSAARAEENARLTAPGGRPRLSDAVEAAATLLENAPEKNRLIAVFTGGMSDRLGKRLLNSLHRKGIRLAVFAVGVKPKGEGDVQCATNRLCRLTELHGCFAKAVAERREGDRIWRFDEPTPSPMAARRRKGRHP